MTFVYQILIHTPLWVWILLAYLVWQGIQSMQPRTTTIWRALIVPVVFIVWGISRIGFGHRTAHGRWSAGSLRRWRCCPLAC